MAPPFDMHDLEYSLPESLIAQQPATRRDEARMLTLDRATGALGDRVIRELPKFLRPDDLLILNDTKVLPAKFTARRKSGGKVAGLFEAGEQNATWQVMLKGSRRLRAGESLLLDTRDGIPMTMGLIESTGGGRWRVHVESDDPLDRILERIGRAPLPPYIRRDGPAAASNGADLQRYQTVYARRPGAIAAPTAGLHFTEELLHRIGDRGAETAYVTLHVGAGTFKPIVAHSPADHVMHQEWYDLPSQTVAAIGHCQSRNGRVVAVGTTTVRVLESAAATMESDTSSDPERSPAILTPRQEMTDLFIYPPYEFRVVDALLTNFHLPHSTLLALVMAFAGIDAVKSAYAHAIRQAYRFYSYGDAMLIS